MDPDKNQSDDERMAALFASAEHEGAPPDRDFLARLREQSTEVFTDQLPDQSAPVRRRSPMIVYAMRILATAAAAAAVVAALTVTRNGADQETVAFDQVLRQVATAQTLHLEVTQDGQSGRAWVRRPGQMRLNLPDGTYEIVRGSRAWLVDERANRAAFRPAVYFRDDTKEFDALRLLKVPKSDDLGKALRTASIEQVRRDGRDASLYRVDVPADEGRIRIEAVVDDQTQMLCTIASTAIRGTRREPIVQVNVLAVDKPVDEELFVVGDTLTEDGRIGKVTDAQGIVSIKPVMHRRWTPVSGPVILKPGDWLRTDVRGANAVSLRLVKDTNITLGPASLAELPSPKRIKLSSGTIKIVAEKKAPIELVGPDGKLVQVKGAAIYHVDRRSNELAELEEPPLWLQGFEGTTAHDSIGSLVANVDGRNVPLTVGYHKVSVDIRDQISRTVIEESFVNRTDSRLEGVFYFPLPQDASISGFGMWIGNELVEADVVEKQRAREIYEEILRAKRDPGLLEWTGGNLFKARVFPIEPHSEKRIKITYTQVLPLKNNRFRYSYGLQSEMLKLHPLRELAIDVRLHSVQPLADVTSPTHMARIDKTAHSAHVEFTAQEHVPERDFEVVVELDKRQEDVVVIPHLRGTDGYFMLLLTPPVSNGGWQRETLADGEPMELLVLADTSGSMDVASRENQAQFIASLLNSLTPQDRINVAVCDVDCEWVFQEPRPADGHNITAARKYLERRISLGWTDLDKAFASALAQTKKGSGVVSRKKRLPTPFLKHVIYVGDGVVTTGDADPVAFSKRLRRLCQDRECSFHGVTVSSSYESIVLKTIASLGGGSVRQISGERTPQKVAVELLAEMTQPVIRDLEVAFHGLRVARVYPEELSNLAAGTQQILLGRYLSEGNDQHGEVVVTGQYGEKPVRFSTKISLKDAEAGNSFIPRLWARMHLDVLLDQGASSVIKDEIIALSEEYHIITPYTSLLVLESDEDRERFKVKRRFQMRGGEKYFAEGRDQADYELLQKQMRLAGNWRLGLRRQVLRELIGLGRDANILQQLSQYSNHVFTTASSTVSVPDGGTVVMGGIMHATTASPVWGMPGAGMPLLLNGQSSFGGFHGTHKKAGAYVSDLSKSLSGDFNGDFGAFDVEDESEAFAEGDDGAEFGESEGKELKQLEELSSLELADDFDLKPAGGPQRAGERSAASEADAIYSRGALAWNARAKKPRSSGPYRMGNKRLDGYGYFGLERDKREKYVPHQDVSWLTSPFGYLASPPVEPTEPPKPGWPAEARALAESLLRTREIADLAGGLLIQRGTEVFDTRWDELTGRSEILALVSPDAWLVRTDAIGSDTPIQWCDRDDRGIFSADLLLGRIREATPADLRHPPAGLSNHLTQSLERTYPAHSVTLKPQSDTRTLFVLKHPTSPANETHILIDSKRHVVLRFESRQHDETTSSTRYEDFVQIAGAWWATRIEAFNKDGERTSRQTLKIVELDKETFTGRMARQLRDRDRVQLLCEPVPDVEDAKQDVADEKASFDHRMTLAVHFALIQNWPRVIEHLEAAEALAEGKHGMRWVRNAVLNQSRRREELRARILDEAASLARSRTPNYFLAGRLFNQASNVCEANEMLELLDALKPIYEQQPDYVKAMKNWIEQRANYLQRTGQTDEVLKLRQQLAEQYPHDYRVHQQYAQVLSNAGEYDAAYAWLDGVITPDARWRTQEEDSLRSTYTGLLQQQGRFARLAEYLAAWVDQDPENETAYSQYLSALVRSDQEKKANRLVARWIKEGQQPAPIEPAVASRLSAAVSLALGQGYNLHTNRIEERWFGPLAEAALFFATHESHSHIADRIMGQWRFRQSDACREVRRKTVKMLTDQIGTLPAGRIQALIGWAMANDPAVEAQVWRRLAKVLEERWAAEDDTNVKGQLAAPLIRIRSSQLTAKEHLAFLRRQLNEGPEPNRAAYAEQLFAALLAQPWSADYENEAFAVLPRLSTSEEPAERLRVQVAALYRLTDRLVQARYEARMAEVEHPENLSRIELREKQKENLRLAREGFAKRLRAAERDHDATLARWMNVERLYLDLRLGRDLEKVREACWEVLGPEPRVDVGDNPTQVMLEGIFLHRHLMMLANLTVRRGTEPAEVNRLLAYLDRGIANAGEDEAVVFVWRHFKYRLLVVLDRPKDLETALGSWIRPEVADNYWRRALGYLAAEQGRIKEAIALFEKIEAADELGPSEYRALAGWYLVADDQRNRERALIETFKWTEEWRLSNWLSQRLQPWQRSNGTLPSELDKDVLRVFAALFQKSAHPQNYQWQLREFYRATKDFRLLAGLADGVVGHTAGKVYPFLEGMQTVLGEIRDEATADSIIEHLAEVRDRAETVVDHRALDMLELMIERRSSEVLNQPGPHVEKALAALKRAFKREWSSGEPRLMANLLASLGRITQKPLAEEQVRQLEVLHDGAEKDSIDRLHIGHALARAYWSYSRHDNAIDLLEAALAEYQTARDGVLPTDANGPLDTFIGYLESRGYFARGEKALMAQLQHPVHRQQTHWLERRLYQLYNSAMRNNGDTSLGSGQTLYRAATSQLIDDLDTDDHNHRYNLINQLCNIYRTAKDKKMTGVVEDLRQFAFKRLPDVLGMQTNNYQSTVNQVAHTLRDLAGPRDGLELLIERIENEPSWFRLSREDGWSQHSYQLARWRSDVGNKLGDLEPRLLKIVIRELKWDLRSQQSRNRNMYHKHYGGYYWSEKTDDFAQAAEEVYEERKGSGAAVKYIADFFYWGVARHSRAIEILLAAHEQKILAESGQSTLVDFMRRQHRFAETIRILEPLVELRPENMQYRVWLMNAYFQVGRQKDLLALLKQTDEFFHQEGRWQESPMASLAHSCLENQLYDRSVAYYEEVIHLHQDTQPRRGIGNGTLSSYYWNLSQAYSGLQKTPEAVDAACGAIVSWGPRHDQRSHALSSLEGVLRSAPDLEQYVAHLDKQAAGTLEDNPTVRKALGKVYFDKREYAKAIPQLKLACELQPNDTETHQKLVACYDGLDDKEAAINQLLDSIRLSRRDIALYKDLTQRYDKLERPHDAERARTSIVEALPNESEGHAALAEIRQHQDRWSDAVVHWQQVARIRSLEPTGLLKLAEAQVHEKQWDEAAQSVRKLRSRTWPQRFGDVDGKARELERQIERGRDR